MTHGAADFPFKVYPMIFIPLPKQDMSLHCGLTKNWKRLPMQGEVLGFAGTEVPYNALVSKFISYYVFEKLMELRPKKCRH